MIIGVAGKYCSGKSTLTQSLIHCGYTEINLDKVGHLCLQMHAEKVAESFGKDIVREDGSIDRKLLGNIVFKDREKREKLEAVLHPRMVDYVLKTIYPSKEKNIVIDGALLFTMGLAPSCDKVFWVRAPLWGRFFRARRRDNLSFLNISRRFWSQRKLRPHASPKDVDIYYIRNAGPHRRFTARIEKILVKRGIKQ